MIEIADVKRLWKYAKKAYELEKYTGDNPNYKIIENKFDLVIVEIYPDEKKAVVTVRGTRGIPAWKENFDAVDREEFERHQARVHEGFWEGFLGFRDKLWEILLPLIMLGFTIEFTGHSRGGALCTITAWRLWEEHKTGSKCVAFAAPRQGGKRYAALIEDTDEIDFLNVQTKFDIVTKVPPRFLGYAHVAPTLVLHTSAFPPLFFVRGLINHSQWQYDKLIENL